jgi:hypothetical protein
MKARSTLESSRVSRRDERVAAQHPRSDESAAPAQRILDFYAEPTTLTSAQEYASLLAELPDDVEKLTHIVQGLAIHEYAARDFYGVEVPDDRKSESHFRSLERMLEQILAINDQPLSIARPPDQRLFGVCHHFALLLVAILRAKGIAARVRFGFGSYFNPGFFEDHSLCEYWNLDEARWVLVDPQFDEVWCRELHIEHDVLDVPRDHFLTAGEAWASCQAGQNDPAQFGIFKGDLRGLWFVAGSLVRDLAALNKQELLQWDTWGAMPRRDEVLQGHRLTFFDRVAALSRAPDASFDELRALYQADERLRVPTTVFNAVLNQTEVI